MPPDSTPPSRQVKILADFLLHGPGIIRDLACWILCSQAKNRYQANPAATRALARALDADLDLRLKKKIAECLSQLVTQDTVDTAWQVWLVTRNRELLNALRLLNRRAYKPAVVRAYSLVYTLLASKALPGEILAGGTSEVITAVTEAACGSDPLLASSAVEVLHQIVKPAQVDVVCSIWAITRHPLLEKLIQERGWIARLPADVHLLACLLNDNLDKILTGDAAMVIPLVTACSDANPLIAGRAKACLPNLQSESAIEAFCQLWNSERSPLLENTLLQACYLPSGPFPLRLKVALKTGRLALMRTLPPQAVPDLLDCLVDRDLSIRRTAVEAAVELPQETREEICRLAIYAGNPEAMTITTQHNFQPASLPDQALLLFLQERWKDYSLLDFDHNYLENVYAAAPDELRKRIAARVRSAGRPEFLSILSGGDLRFHSATYTPEEAETLFTVLASNRDYTAIWKMIPFLPVRLSIQALQILFSVGWKPMDSNEQIVMDEWVTLSQSLPDNPIQLVDAIPWAIPCTSLHVRGRINAISFAPQSSLLAIATGERQLVVWNYAQAEVQTVYSGFSHSLGQVVYAGADLYCAERSNIKKSCAIYRCYDNKTHKIGEHNGQVTSLIPLGENQVISTGRDGLISIWDRTSSSLIHSTSESDWPRTALKSPDQSHFFTFTETIQAWRLPDLTPQPELPYKRVRASGYRASPIYSAAFSTDAQTLLTGQANGRVLAYLVSGTGQTLCRALLTAHPGAVRHIEFLAQRSIVATAGVEGQIRIFSWPSMDQSAQINLPEGRLASLAFSSNGYFMAAGGNEAELTLWDLRMEQIQSLISRPLAASTLDDLSLSASLADNPTLNPSIRCMMELITSLMRYRYRFDIHIEDTLSIRPGEFDILL